MVFYIYMVTVILSCLCLLAVCLEAKKIAKEKGITNSIIRNSKKKKPVNIRETAVLLWVLVPVVNILVGTIIIICRREIVESVLKDMAETSQDGNNAF